MHVDIYQVNNDKRLSFLFFFLSLTCLFSSLAYGKCIKCMIESTNQPTKNKKNPISQLEIYLKRKIYHNNLENSTMSNQ